jgi:ribonuclease Z
MGRQRLRITGFALTLAVAVVVAAEPAWCGTQVVLLGTGNPNPDPQHSGCSVAIIAGGTPYVVDFGPGVVRQAAAMSPSYGGAIEALEAENITHAFLTHLHSDHTVGLPDLVLTPWVMGRDEPLQLWGPEGIVAMTQHVLEAYREDIRYRTYGQEPANDRGWRVEAHAIKKEGVVFKDENVTVEAFPVAHGSWPNAWGFRFTTADKVIVVSGDTRPSENIVKYAQGADILVHEVYSDEKYKAKPQEWKQYHAAHHTSSLELGEIAAKAKPKLLVLYHILFWGASEEELLSEIAQVWDGQVIVGRDLLVIE